MNQNSFAAIIVVLDHCLRPWHVTIWYVWLQWGNFGDSVCKVTSLASGALLIYVYGCGSAFNKLCFSDLYGWNLVSLGKGPDFILKGKELWTQLSRHVELRGLLVCYTVTVWNFNFYVVIHVLLLLDKTLLLECKGNYTEGNIRCFQQQRKQGRLVVKERILFEMESLKTSYKEC